MLKVTCLRASQPSDRSAVAEGFLLGIPVAEGLRWEAENSIALQQNQRLPWCLRASVSGTGF